MKSKIFKHRCSGSKKLVKLAQGVCERERVLSIGLKSMNAHSFETISIDDFVCKVWVSFHWYSTFQSLG